MTIKRRLTQAVVSVGVAGGLLFGTIGATAPVAASVKIDNTGDGVEDIAYRWVPFRPRTLPASS